MTGSGGFPTRETSVFDRWRCSDLLTSASGHVQIELRRLPQARLLWVNDVAVRDDPHFARLGGEEHAYSNHLLQSCAWTIRQGESDTTVAHPAACAIGWCDRYGGSGVGVNGGSGRGALINGYLVKGVGRTPLVNASTPVAHASGGAYFEEGVREIIFSQIAALEYPHSAVPVLALIDTGHIQTWDLDHGPSSERRVLLVRPPVLRAAHFERAVGFDSGRLHEGHRDTDRVRAMFDRCADLFGLPFMEGAFVEFGARLAKQVACGFARRLPHGSPNTSNVALDGRLLDFGAMSAVPSWGDVATMLTRQPFHRLQETAQRSLRSLAFYVAQHWPGGRTAGQEIGARMVEACGPAFRVAVVRQALGTCGAEPHEIDGLVSATEMPGLWATVTQVIAHYQRERIEFVDGAAEPRIPWDLDRLWDNSPPAHLRDLHNLVKSIVPSERWAQAQDRCRVRVSPRPHLYREPMKQRLYSQLELGANGPMIDPQRLRKFIACEVDRSLSR